MCLAIPGQLIDINEHNDPLARTGLADFSGVRVKISLAYVPDAKINDYVIVHAGFALSVLNADEALVSLTAFEDLSSADRQA